MPRIRLSLAWLMILVGFTAVGFAALHDPSVLWASAVFTVDVAAVCGALVGGLLLRGRDRARAVGFAVFAGSYLLLVFGLFPTENGVSAPPVVTRAALDVFRQWQEPLVTNKNVVVADKLPRGEGVTGIAAARNTWNWLNHRRIGHGLAALLFGLMGACLGGWCTRRTACLEAAQRPV
jgi:hypothetical protein